MSLLATSVKASVVPAGACFIRPGVVGRVADCGALLVPRGAFAAVSPLDVGRITVFLDGIIVS